MKKHLPALTQNWLRAMGAVLALVALFIILFLLSINLVIGVKNPYLGIVLYIGRLSKVADAGYKNTTIFVIPEKLDNPHLPATLEERQS